MNNQRTYLKNFLQFDTFHFSKGLISDNNEQSSNILEKLLQFDTFHFSNDLISDKIEQNLNIF